MFPTKTIVGGLIAFVLLIVLFMSYANIRSGYVGIEVKRYGNDRGVSVLTLSPGHHFVSPNSDVFKFPTFTQTKTWEGNEKFSFQTSNGMDADVEMGVSYHVEKDNAPKVFQKYRMGIDEVTNVYLKAMIRNAVNLAGSKVTTDEAYGDGKGALQTAIQDRVTAAAADVGITIENVFIIGKVGLPPNVIKSINDKVQADQEADRKESEVRGVKADADKRREAARGEADAINTVGAALRANPEFTTMKMIEGWDGALPMVQGDGKTIIQLPPVTQRKAAAQ